MVNTKQPRAENMCASVCVCVLKEIAYRLSFGSYVAYSFSFITQGSLKSRVFFKHGNNHANVGEKKPKQNKTRTLACAVICSIVSC